MTALFRASVTFALAMTLMHASPVAHAQAPADDALAAQRELLAATIQREAARDNLEKYIERAISDLYRMDPDGIVTPDHVSRYEEVVWIEAFFRAFHLLELEIKDDQRNQRLAAQAGNLKMHGQADTDGDGALTFGEMMAFSTAQAAAVNDQRSQRAESNPMVFDQNGDNRVDAEEVRSAIIAIASDVASAPKMNPDAIRQRQQQQVKCTAPPVPDGAEVVLLSGYNGGGVSTVAVSGPDEDTSVADIVIEPGDKPLYVAAAAQRAIVWKLSGATDRVAAFVVQPVATRNGPGAGVTGLDSGKVHFIAARSCFRPFRPEMEGGAIVARAAMSAHLGHDIEHLVSSERLIRVSLPSGKTVKSEDERLAAQGTIVVVGDARFLLTANGPRLLEDRPAATGEAKLSFYPNGVIDLKVADVVAPGPVAAYEVLPGEAGLREFIRSGAMRVTPDGYYMIEKPIPRFPAGLNGSHSVKFILAKGVPLPAGDPGHSPVVSEETGECVGGDICRILR